MRYRVKLAPAAAETFSNLHPDKKKQIKAVMLELDEQPYTGKPLQNELIGLRSLKMKRYMIVYRVDDKNRAAIVYAIGHRRDIYESITTLVNRRSGL